MAKVKVRIELEVIDGEYCWNAETGEMCPFFERDSYHAQCQYDFGDLIAVPSDDAYSKGYYKPFTCPAHPLNL